MGDGFDGFEGFTGLDTTIAIVEELSDLDEITSVVALYLANNVVLPESEPFDDIIAVSLTHLTLPTNHTV